MAPHLSDKIQHQTETQYLNVVEGSTMDKYLQVDQRENISLKARGDALLPKQKSSRGKK